MQYHHHFYADQTLATTTITMAILPMPPNGIGRIDMGIPPSPPGLNLPWQYIVGVVVVITAVIGVGSGVAWWCGLCW